MKNILLLFTDQQRYDTIHAHGNEKIHTPNFDKLAANGVSFTRAYTPSPVCVAARYAMHTGLLPHHTACFDNAQTVHRTSFMEVLRDNGYYTHSVGKMHFTLKDDAGSESMWGFDSRDKSEECGAVDDYKHYIDSKGFSHVVEPLGFRSEMYYIPQVSQMNIETHNSSWVAEKSIDFLKNREQDKPFFLMSSFIKPHPPFETPVPWNKLYRTIDVPPAKCPDGNDDVTTYWNYSQNVYKYRSRGTDLNLYRTMKAAYYAAISFVDYNVGRILSYMKEEGLLDNTLILFTSDHGELMGDYNCYGKRSFVDSAARVPMIMYDPDTQGGITCDSPVSLVDIFETFTDAAGIDSSNIKTDGDSLLRVAKGEVRKDHVIGQFSNDATALYMYTTNACKYIYSAADNKEYLFDLINDPDETINYADDENYSDIKSKYKQKIISEYKSSALDKAMGGIDINENEFTVYPIRQRSTNHDDASMRQDTETSIPDMKDFITW